MKLADLRNVFKNASERIFTSPIVVFTDSLSPIPLTSKTIYCVYIDVFCVNEFTKGMNKMK